MKAIHPKEYLDPEKDIAQISAFERVCRRCGCTDMDCFGCIERTGEPCHWVEADLCSACSNTEQLAPEEVEGYSEAEEDLSFEDIPDDVVIGYHCNGCGHTQASNGWGGECDVCSCNSLEEIYE